MTKYREILRLTALGLSLRNIQRSLHVSQRTIMKVQHRAKELSLSFQRTSSCGYRKNWYAGEWSIQVLMAKKRSYSCSHCFTQIVICGECGEMFRRIHWNNRGCKSIVWRCISRLEPTGQECHARTVNETILENVVVHAINTLLGDTSTYLPGTAPAEHRKGDPKRSAKYR